MTLIILHENIVYLCIVCAPLTCLFGKKVRSCFSTDQSGSNIRVVKESSFGHPWFQVQAPFINFLHQQCDLTDKWSIFQGSDGHGTLPVMWNFNCDFQCALCSDTSNHRASNSVTCATNSRWKPKITTIKCFDFTTTLIHASDRLLFRAILRTRLTEKLLGLHPGDFCVVQ